MFDLKPDFQQCGKYIKSAVWEVHYISSYNKSQNLKRNDIIEEYWKETAEKESIPSSQDIHADEIAAPKTLFVITSVLQFQGAI